MKHAMEMMHENRINVLIVDDEVDFTELMLHALRNLPYSISAVNSGESALDYIKSNRVDILITDVRMPDISGFQLMEKAHALNPDTHVIAISAHGRLDTAVEFMKKGAVDYLQKPVDNVDVQLAIESAADKWRLRQELHIANRHLKRVNESLQHEIRERKHAEASMLASNQELQSTLIELKNTQKQLIKQERLGALGQMARGVAHDFNNALQPIMLAAGFVQSNPEKLMEMGILNEYIDEIVQAADAAAVTVKRLVRFYSPVDKSEITVINLNRLIESVIDITQPRWKNEAMAQGKTIDIDVQLTPGAMVDGFRDALREVFVNLIFNAVEAIEERGTIRIATRLQDEWVEITVQDDGGGMSEEIRAKCLEPFVTTRMQKGSGLGLSVVYGAIEQHRGTMDVESELGVGTTIRMRLPVAVGVAEAEDSDEPVIKRVAQNAQGEAVNYRILVVDDELPMRRMLGRVLKRLGHDVDVADNGVVAWEKAQTSTYDLIITDQAMPEMAGDRLAELVKGAHPETPVIMVTGFGDILRAREHPPEHIDCLLSKPVQIEQLTDAIHSVMALRSGGTAL